MKKVFILLSLIMFIFGCNPAPKNKQILAKINDYEITLNQFNDEFGDSSYSGNGTPEAKKDFINVLINRALILQYAQKRGLDRDKSFLKMIERFWEQSLLKLTLDRETKETADSVAVSDKEIEDAYNNMVKEGRTEKPYSQMYQQIKWEINRSRQTQLLNDWINRLHKDADIKVNYDLLKETK